jgi:organic radical activating enzyme
MIFDQFEFHVVSHCNLACRGCNHASPQLKRELVEEKSVQDDIDHLKRLGISTKILRVLGGEPLLHPKIDRLLHRIKETGLAAELHVVTNGVLLGRMTRDFWDTVDAVQVSLYPGISIPESVKNEPKLRINRFDQFYETFSFQRNADSTAVERIWDACRLRNRTLGVVNGYLYKCMRAPYIGKLLHFGPRDGILLSSATSEAVQDYFECNDPLAACSHCAGTSGKFFEHTQLPRAAWLSMQNRSIEEMVEMANVPVAI